MYSGERGTLIQKIPQSFEMVCLVAAVFIKKLMDVIIGLERIHVFTRCFVFGMRIAVHPRLYSEQSR